MTTSPAQRHSWVAGPSAWLAVLGAGQIILGGLVAAATAPLGLPHGSWLAAYLVLVGGVAQYVMGRAPAWFIDRPAPRSVVAQIVGWNAGNAAVMSGTLATMPYLVDAGGLAILLVLVSRIRSILRSHRDPTTTRQRSVVLSPTSAALVVWPRRVYLALLIVLTVSIPVGLALAHVGAG